MYRKASKRVLKDLNKAFESNRREMAESAHTIVAALQKDFEMILSNCEMLEVSEVARDHIRKVMEGVDTRFADILGNEPMKVDPTEPAECEHQKREDVSMAAVDAPPAEAAEAVPVSEARAIDTAL